MLKHAAAVGIIAAGLVVAGAAVRLARPGDMDALTAAAAAAAPVGGVPGLIMVTDPDCPACAVALAELTEVVRPGELGLAVRILESDRAGRALLDAVGPGLVPLFVVVDGSGRPVAVLRGARPPELLRAWLEGAAAQALAKPLDRRAPRGPP